MIDNLNVKPQGKHERTLHVIEIAKSLFIKQGYCSTTTAQIAKTAGIAELTLFRYFATKRKLFEAVIQPLVELEELANITINDAEFSYNNLKKFIQKKVAFVREHRELVRLVISESQFQPELIGDFNPVNNLETQLYDLFIRKGLNPQISMLIIQLIKGFLLSTAFTPRSGEDTITAMEKMTEAQIFILVKDYFAI